MKKDLETSEIPDVKATDELELEDGPLTEVCASKATARIYEGGYRVYESFGH